jgi:alkylation response protein AidB-like acyl-CoA dehydrogenase
VPRACTAARARSSATSSPTASSTSRSTDIDLQLTDEQRWLSETVEELVTRTDEAELWPALVEFGALDVADGGLGAVELALVARGLGAALAGVPFVETAAVRYAAEVAGVVTPCLSEPGRGFAPAAPWTSLADDRVTGEKDEVTYAAAAELFACPASANGSVALALVRASEASVEPEPTLDERLAPARVRFEAAAVEDVVGDGATVERIAAAGGVLASAEAVGAAASILELAREYAVQRQQFGRPIGSFQAVRHILADMFVRLESSWSSVLYAAASLDERTPDAARTAAIAKAYAARATQEVAHGALQVFGGIAFTAEHPAHRYLRRIVVRGVSFGSAREHERAIGRTLSAAP